MRKKHLINVCGRIIEVQGRLVRIARLDGELFSSLDDPGSSLNQIREAGVRIDLFTFLQKLPDTSAKHPYPMEWDNLAVLPVSTFDHWWTKQIDSKVRNMVRKADKQRVVIREVPFGDRLLQDMCAIYNECPIRQGKHFVHYGMTLEIARGYAGTFLDRSIYIGAFLGETMIGFVKMVADEARVQANVLHILSMVCHKDKAPTNALLAQAVRTCAEHGIRYLTYDRFAYGKKQGDSLSKFKETIGFRRVDIPRYYVPLTPLGKATLRLGLHHKLVERIPESVMFKLRELRSVWYARKLRISTDPC